MNIELFDVEDIKKRADILSIVGATVALKRRGSSFTGLCPFHAHVKNTPSFVVWPATNTWRCFGLCAEGGDVITFVMKRDGLTFRQACERLGGATTTTPTARATPPTVTDTPPSIEWQSQGWRLIERASEFLHSADGVKAMTYLRSQRLLNHWTIERWRLGFVPEDYYMPFESWGLASSDARPRGLWLPRGIVIPTFTVDGTLWAIHIRRATGDPKYPHIAGSKKALWGSQNVDRRMVFIFGGEFDAMLAEQECAFIGGCCSPSTGEGSSWSSSWTCYLMSADVICAAYDADAPGQSGAWKNVMSVTGRAIRTPPPILNGGKDITDYARAGGSIARWMMDVRQRYLTAHDSADVLAGRLANCDPARFVYCQDLRIDHALLLESSAQFSEAVL